MNRSSSTWADDVEAEEAEMIGGGLRWAIKGAGQPLITQAASAKAACSNTAWASWAPAGRSAVSPGPEAGSPRPQFCACSRAGCLGWLLALHVPGSLPTHARRACAAAAEEGIPLHAQPNLAPLAVKEEEAEAYPEPAGPALPDRPPFKVYVSNIPYELDDNVVERYFQGLRVGAAGIGLF